MFHAERTLGVQEEKATNLGATLKRLAQHFKPYWPVVLIVAILTIAAFRRIEKVLIEPIRNVLNRFAQIEDRIQHKLQATALGSQDQVVAEARVATERFGDHPVN